MAKKKDIQSNSAESSLELFSAVKGEPVEFEPVSKGDGDCFFREMNPVFNVEELVKMMHVLEKSIANRQIKVKDEKKHTNIYTSRQLNLIRQKKPLKRDTIDFLANFLLNKSNLEIYLKSIPKEDYELLHCLAEKGSITLGEAKKICGDTLVRSVSSGFWGEVHLAFSARFPWLIGLGSSSKKENLDESVRVCYQKKVDVYFSRVMVNATPFPIGVEEIPQGLNIYRGCPFFEKSYPVMSLLFDQGQIDVDERLRPKVSTLKNIKQKTAFVDFLQDVTVPDVTATTLSLFTSMYQWVSARTKNRGLLAFARELVSSFSQLNSFLFCLLFMPHIKGFRKTDFSCREGCFFAFLVRLFEILKHTGEWTEVKQLANSMKFFKNGYDYEFDLTRTNLFRYSNYALRADEFSLVRNIDGIQMVTIPCIKVVLACLASFGIVDVAFREQQKSDVSPFDVITHIKITDLGRYAFKLTDKYEPAQTEKRDLFELDDERLIVKNIVDDNPYIDILKDIANYAGNNRFQLTCESFLKTCSVEKDVDNKIEIFKQFICANPPAIWETFFNEIKKHTNPLKGPKDRYELFQLDESNKELIRYVCSDPELKKYAIRAENYLLLVKATDKRKFIDRLKVLGYLV